MNYYVIYKMKNTVNDKVYIGRTCDLARRYREHFSHARKDPSPFHNDVIKYGMDAFECTVLSVTKDRNESDRLEQKYIAEYRNNLGMDNVYNICKGGTGGQTHDVTGPNNPMYGKHQSDEAKLAISKAFKGKKRSEEFCRKVSEGLKGKKKTPEHVAKRSHRIKLININTNEIREFNSKAEATRLVGFDYHHYVKHPSYATKDGWTLYCKTEDVETIESMR